jgi:hypothetical protein
MVMEKIYYDDSTYIWKTKLNRLEDKQLFLNEAYSVIESQPDVKTDGFAYKSEWNGNLDFTGDFIVKTKSDHRSDLSVFVRNWDGFVQLGKLVLTLLSFSNHSKNGQDTIRQ